MKKEIKQKWINAVELYLTSGKQLLACPMSTLESFSIDGILCDLYLGDKNKEWGKIPYTFEGINKLKYACLGISHHLPKAVLQWAGITKVDYPITFTNKEIKETNYLTSPHIANLINRNFEMYPKIVEDVINQVN